MLSKVELCINISTKTPKSGFDHHYGRNEKDYKCLLGSTEKYQNEKYSQNTKKGDFNTIFKL